MNIKKFIKWCFDDLSKIEKDLNKIEYILTTKEEAEYTIKIDKKPSGSVKFNIRKRKNNEN